MKIKYVHTGTISDLASYRDELIELVKEYEKLDGGDYQDDQDKIDEYDEFIDECHHEGIKIFSFNYSASKVFKDADPIAYNLGFDEYMESSFRDSLNDSLGDIYGKIHNEISCLQETDSGTKPPLWDVLSHINKELTYWAGNDCQGILRELNSYLDYLVKKYKVYLDQ